MIWISIKDAAQLMDLSDRGMRKKKKSFQYRFIHGQGRSGRKIEILLESLPLYAQEKYNAHNQDDYLDFISSYTGQKQDNAMEKLALLRKFQHSNLPLKVFLEQWNFNHSENPITLNQFYSWKRKYREGGINALVDGRGSYTRESSIRQEAWDYFYELYMRESKPGVQRCWEFTKRMYPEIPSVKSFERAVKKIPKLALIRYREGEKAYRDQLPAMERSRLDISSNEIWFSDHHKIDVAVKNKQGKVLRPWLTAFYDARSNKLISFILRDKAPDSTVVKQCLEQGILKYGIPQNLYYDNGKDYREKSFDKKFPAALTTMLDLNVIYAQPYHGQAKTVERFFRTLEERFCKFIPTYLGRDAKQRPEAMQKCFKDLGDVAPDIDYFRQLLSDYLEEYNNTKSQGADMGNQSPNTVYTDNLTIMREVEDKTMLHILCGSFEERVITKSGIQYEQRFYYSDDFAGHLGERVYINYDAANMDELNIFSLEMQFICKVQAKLRTPFRHTSKEDIKEAKKEIKKNKKKEN